MLKSINKIKGLGIFTDFHGDSSLPDFKKYNLVYGWNGCGKTTLTKLFTFLESGASTEYPTLEYEVKSPTNTYKQGESFESKIRVFNRDYIANNVERIDGKKSPIFILGEENKKLVEEIAQDEALLIGKESKLKSQKEELASKEKDWNKQFTDIARTISTNTSGLADRTYRAPEAKTAFAALAAKILLTEEEEKKCKLTLRQEIKTQIQELSSLDWKTLNELKPKPLSEVFVSIKNESTSLLQQTVTSTVIERLRSNSDISSWVEQGMALHEKHNSGTCEYCNQVIPPERIEALSNHFNDADKNLKNELQKLIDELKGIEKFIVGIHVIDKANFYEELQSELEQAATDFAQEQYSLLEKVSSLAQTLEDKKAHTTESQTLEITIDPAKFIAAREVINNIIRKHNSKTTNFNEEKKDAESKLEKHYLSTIFDEVHDLNVHIENIKKAMSILSDGDTTIEGDLGIAKLKSKIEESRSKISSAHKACAVINERLKTFLGHEELVFEVEGDGYIVKRSGKVAKNLSEGELTAIAFMYFTVHLQDQNFDISSGIIVIDDPISSLDSNSMFQAFSFLKNSVKDAKQVFIFTHNFDFLKLLLGWLDYCKPDRSLYMIKNDFDENEERIASIAKLDSLLCDYDSEYHYLFKMLTEYKSDGTIETAYAIPNIARKVLETFLMFRVPNMLSTFKKLELLTFDENKKTAINKFANELSHKTGKGFDPSLVQETQKNVQYLLEMMEAVFPEHYKILTDSISTT